MDLIVNLLFGDLALGAVIVVVAGLVAGVHYLVDSARRD